MKRNKIMAFVIGAGVNGTLLILPYLGLACLRNVLPQFRDIYNIFFLAPLVWGFWNWLYISLHKPFAIGAWGALLGFIVCIAIDIFICVKGLYKGLWFPSAFIAPVIVVAFYALLWHFIIAPLNSELEV